MSTTTNLVAAESAVEQSLRTAEALGSKTLFRWLESSGPWLLLAGKSTVASDLVHSYRITRDIAAASESSIAREAYTLIRDKLNDFLKSVGIESELRTVIELDLRRADALLSEIGKQSGRTVRPSGLVHAVMMQEASELLQAWSKHMKSGKVSEELRDIYSKIMARIKPDDYGWAAIGDIALDRAKAVKEQYPSLSRGTYKQNTAAQELIEGSYTNHGKGELFEHFGRNDDLVASRIDSELRAGAQRAAQRGVGWKPMKSVGEIRYGYEIKGGAIGGWKKAPDGAVLIVKDTSPEAAAGASVAVKVDGIAEPTAFFQFKAEAQASKIPQQQLEDLPRILDPWAEGKPVYISLGVADETGKVTTKTYLLKPPDSKSGLTYYGIATDQVFIGERDALAKQGANVMNLNLDIHNDDLRSIWDELFWMAFESL